MIESTERPAWLQYESQGRGNGLNAHKHKYVRRGNTVEIIRNFYEDATDGKDD